MLDIRERADYIYIFQNIYIATFIFHAKSSVFFLYFTPSSKRDDIAIVTPAMSLPLRFSYAEHASAAHRLRPPYMRLISFSHIYI